VIVVALPDALRIKALLNIEFPVDAAKNPISAIVPLPCVSENKRVLRNPAYDPEGIDPEKDDIKSGNSPLTFVLPENSDTKPESVGAGGVDPPPTAAQFVKEDTDPLARDMESSAKFVIKFLNDHVCLTVCVLASISSIK
jgi:hypothetical protein